MGCPRGVAGRCGNQTDEGIHDLTVVADRELDRREFGAPPQADQTLFLSCLDLIARLDPHTVPPHMRILRRPAVTMVDDHAVAALPNPERLGTDLAQVDIGYSGPHRPHSSGCGCPYLDTFHHGDIVPQAKIGPAVPMVSELPAGIIPMPWSGVEVHIILNETVGPDRAGERQFETDILCSGGEGPGGRHQDEHGG